MDSDATREVHLPHQMAPQPPSPKHIHLYVNKYTSHKGAHRQQLFGTHQVDTNVDQRSQVREEGNDWLPMKCQTNPFNQTASCLPLHLPPEKQHTEIFISHTFKSWSSTWYHTICFLPLVTELQSTQSGIFQKTKNLFVHQKVNRLQVKSFK